MNKAPEIEVCSVCGGDGHIENAWGQRAKCPSCHGSGRRRVDTGFHDVTKTKASHHQPSNRLGVVVKETRASTPLGVQLTKEVEASKLDAAAKARFVQEIFEHEASHGTITKTFVKKLRKSAGLAPGG